MDSEIRRLTIADLSQLQAHLTRHRAESGRNEPYFMPVEPGDALPAKVPEVQSLKKRFTECGWERWFVAVMDDGRISGHLQLKADGWKAGIHRCSLGIGIERQHRGQGLGRRMMETAITVARQVETLAWIDLHVFAHNSNAKSLYQSLGFTELGVVEDRFRIGGDKIDDVIMTLMVAN